MYYWICFCFVCLFTALSEAIVFDWCPVMLLMLSFSLISGWEMGNPQIWNIEVLQRNVSEIRGYWKREASILRFYHKEQKQNLASSEECTMFIV